MPGSDFHILVVDDEPDLEPVISQRFRRRNDWRFSFRSNGAEALQWIDQAGDIDFVLTDLRMPQMDGLTLMARLAEREPPIKTVVISAYSDLDSIRTAMNRGAFDFITKPINLTDLEATIGKTASAVEKERDARRSADQLARAREELEVQRRVEDLKTEFFANVSHEFRTPLTLLLGPIDDALASSYGQLGHIPIDHLHRMQKHARRLKLLIDQLLHISRIEAGRERLATTRSNLSALVSGAVDSFADSAARSQISLRFEARETDIYLIFDAPKIETVVLNLLSNALKHTPIGGTIRVRVAKTSTGARLEVRDSGAGIAPEEISHIFDRFHRVETSGRSREGTGIGLALTRSLVHLHRGAISVESEPGFGTTFIVLLPEQPQPTPANALTDRPAFAGSRDDVEPDLGLPAAIADPSAFVLVVDDDPDLRAYVAGHLRRYYEVAEASDGEEALAKARARKPHLIIADVMMPRMDGYGLCRSVKSDDTLNDVPIILLTSKASDADRVEGLVIGADDYLCKPFNARELLVRAENLIAVRRLLRSRYSDEVVIGGSDISVSSADAEFLSRIRDCIEEHLDDPQFTISRAAEEIGISDRQLRRRLRDLIDVSPSAYLRALRLARARRLLEQQAGNVSEIAYEVGFRDAKHFSRLFRQVYGILPTQVGENGRSG